ncbi:hypothetical protein IW262DRAFT_1292502 [Armillaria fumosa]|nr:hypothetical protein IW262DRAFT_1292502 [Armillaria fumosa]
MQNIDMTYLLGENLPTKTNLVTMLGHTHQGSKHKPVDRPQRATFDKSEMVPKVPPPPDPFPKFDAEVLKILQQFEDFLVSKTPSDYVKFLLRCYFKDSSWQQGEIGLFVKPLDVLYKMQEAHRSISMKALRADGPSKCQKRLDCAGNGIGTLISWLEDIWRAGINGPYGLCVTYNRNRLAWQRETKKSK